ncbi:MAG: hypothetical protein AAFQ37_09240 [Bacteroidota bacterium]
MQRITTSLLILSLLTMVFLGFGCGEDDPGTGGTTALPPTISLASDFGFVSMDTDVPLSSGFFSVRINVNDGDSPLNTLTITQDGTTIPFDSLEFDNGNTTSQNPFLIAGADQSGTTYDVDIFPLSPVANGSSTFNFTVADQEGRSASTSITITFTSTPPTVTFGPNGLQSDQERSVLDAPFTLDIEATNGDAVLTSIAFYQDGVLLPADSVIELSGFVDPIVSNPLPLADINALFRRYEIHPVDPAEGASTFRVEAVDALGVSGDASITITYIVPEVTTISGVLLNQAGDTGTGGLDLDTGTGTGSNDMEAEIQDEGINTDLVPANNWRQQISAANDAELRVVDPTTFDGFDNVTNVAQIIAAFDGGTTPAGDDTVGGDPGEDPVTGEDVTEPILIGDVFVVRRGDNYYLIRIDNITVRESDNDDNYELSIKK